VLRYENDWVLIEKPPGITVHRSKNTPKRQRVLTTSVKKQLARKVYPVHRLDHRTSGAILFAFNSETAGKLHDAAIRKGHKKYFALLRGEWTYPTTKLVDKPLKLKGNVTKNALTNFTLLATTTYDAIRQDGNNTDAVCCLVLCEPITGRTHQIRRHAREIGHPTIGDSEHGNSQVNRFWRERGLNRLALHCWALDFCFEGKRHNCIAPIPAEFRGVLEKYMPDSWEMATKLEPTLLMKPYDIVDGTHGRNYRKKLQKEME
jgi:tRNA pseudouridine65 synthase